MASISNIEIVWQTHLIRPAIYRDDCLRLFHRIIDHSLLLNDVEYSLKEQAFLNTCHLYEKHFSQQYCSLPLYNNRNRCVFPICFYWDETYFKFSSYPPEDYENPFSFTEADIILDGNWLKLSATYPRTGRHDFIHPTYAIDLICHSHMQEPLKYANDCNRLFGCLVDHCPWPSVERIQMKDSYDDVNQYWKETFQNDMPTDHLLNS